MARFILVFALGLAALAAPAVAQNGTGAVPATGLLMPPAPYDSTVTPRRPLNVQAQVTAAPETRPAEAAPGTLPQNGSEAAKQAAPAPSNGEAAQQPAPVTPNGSEAAKQPAPVTPNGSEAAKQPAPVPPNGSEAAKQGPAGPAKGAEAAPQPSPMAPDAAEAAKPAAPASPNGTAAARNGASPVPQNGVAAETKPAETTEGRFTFSRMNDGYVRLDNRTGQVSFCSKRTVGWTCQLAAEDRGVLENEIARLQEENASLKKDLLTRGLPLPGGMKDEPRADQAERQPFGLPADPNLERMKEMVEKVWRQLVDMITTLQKDILKKS
jgi:hypothetical protein